MKRGNIMSCPCNNGRKENDINPMAVIYPYPNGIMNACGCCPPPPPIGGVTYPSSGLMQESAFMLIDKTPYIIDNTQVEYGKRISVSENIYTRITRRTDVACLNMAATFDLTDTIITNTLWNSYLNDMISQAYATLEGVLPIQMSGVKFKLTFHIENASGGIEFSSNVSYTVQKNLFHYTDVMDYFVQSFKGMFITEIPQMDFNGVYNFVIDKLEAFVDTFDTKEHIVNDLNPYYQFTNNNTRIVMQHDTIAQETPDDNILIAGIDINQAFPFQANLTTKVKISFTAFTANMIATGNTYDVYKCLTNPTDITIAALLKKINDLEIALAAEHEALGQYEESNDAAVAAINTKLDGLYMTSVEYAKGIELKKGVFTYLEIGTVYQVAEDYTVTDDETTTLAEDLAADIDAGKLVSIKD